MVTKANRAAAQDWQNEQKELARNQEDLEEQQTMLWYAAEKRDVNFPSPDTLERLGHADVAAKVREAYGLLSDAYYMFERKMR
jgi:hypothetical protein